MLSYLFILAFAYICLKSVRSVNSEPLPIVICRLANLYPLIIVAALKYMGLTHGLMAVYSAKYEAIVNQAYVGLIIANLLCDAGIFFALKVAGVGGTGREIVFSTWHCAGAKLVLPVLLTIFAALAYPHAFFLSDVNSRFNLLPGASTVFIFLLACSFTLRADVSMRFSICILLLFLLMQGERADIMLPLLYFFLSAPDGNNVALKSSSMKVIVTMTIIFMLSVFAFMMREDLSVRSLVVELLFQNTVVDVVHVYLTGYLYVAENGYNTAPLVNIASSFLPSSGGVKDPNNYTELLQSTVANPGGGLAVTAFYIAFGYAGIAFFSFFSPFLLCLNAGRSAFRSTLVVVFMFLWLRLSWYGVTYTIRIVEMVAITSLFFLIAHFATRRQGIAYENA